jgi:cytochrome c-type biogenesis protein
MMKELNIKFVILLVFMIPFVECFLPRNLNSLHSSRSVLIRKELPQQRPSLSIKMSFRDIGLQIYDVQLYFSKLVDTELGQVTPVSTLLLYIAGLFTAFSPCAMGLVPLTVAYLSNDYVGSSSASSDSDTSSIKTIINKSQNVRSLFYALGLATTLSIFGLIAAYVGNMYGSTVLNSGEIGDILSCFTGVLILVMGLNLLELLPFEFPSIDFGDSLKSLSGNTRAFFVGASTALVASPCSSPVLTSLLAVVAASGNPFLGASLLFAYSFGYATPVVAAGFLSRSVSNAASSQGLPIVNTIIASGLVAFGTYNILNSAYHVIL